MLCFSFVFITKRVFSIFIYFQYSKLLKIIHQHSDKLLEVILHKDYMYIRSLNLKYKFDIEIFIITIRFHVT